MLHVNYVLVSVLARSASGRCAGKESIVDWYAFRTAQFQLPEMLAAYVCSNKLKYSSLHWV
ncbi:hypothetical protein KC19_VG076500 [Ceratodon purpureus]|uniref:Uncharacterized protein n=1 Tax=Ceratodon purpureus TaxID=3225 RepID=A0A8T0HN06_CERPU|nr:hypothetical protein KC19_VG076500 [Ceratodon purpureus]